MSRLAGLFVLTIAVASGCRTEQPVEPRTPPRHGPGTPVTEVPTASTVLDLGTFPGASNSIARSLNASGLAVGLAFPEFSSFLGVVFGPQVDSIPVDSANHVVDALGINDAGVVTGQSVFGAFVFTPGGVADTLPSPPGYPSYLGAAINNHGDVAGFSRYTLGGFVYPRATLWRNTGSGYSPVDLGLLDGASTEATAIAPNLSGTDVLVAGYSNADVRHAFTWRDGVFAVLPTLPSAYSPWTEAYDVTDDGMVVGWGYDGGGEAALLWRGAQVTSLEPACASRSVPGQSRAYGIARSAGRILIVGRCAGRPMVWYTNGGEFAAAFLSLLPGDVSGVAYDVNASGQVVGVSQGTNSHAVRWTFSPFLLFPPLADPSCSDCGTASLPVDSLVVANP